MFSVYSAAESIQRECCHTHAQIHANTTGVPTCRYERRLWLDLFLYARTMEPDLGVVILGTKLEWRSVVSMLKLVFTTAFAFVTYLQTTTFDN